MKSIDKTIVAQQRTFQVRAFMPELLNEKSSPLAGIGSVFIEVRATSVEDAYNDFYSRRAIMIDLTASPEDPKKVIMVNPLTCPMVLIEEISGDMLEDQISDQLVEDDDDMCRPRTRTEHRTAARPVARPTLSVVRT